MKKIFSFIFCCIFLTIFGLKGDCSNLPKELSNYLIKIEPGISIRYDGLVNCPDGTVYIPVVPAQKIDVKDMKVKYSLPAGKTFAQRPYAITFANNYSLLKVINKGKKKTVTDYGELPVEITTGILPQDLLVPNGFYIPETLRGILGDIDVPVISNDIPKTYPSQGSNKSVKLSAQKSVVSSGKMKNTNIHKVLKNKMFLVTDGISPFIKIFVPSQAQSVYDLKFSGTLKDIKQSPDKKYIFALTCGKTTVDIADLVNEQIAGSIDLEVQPSEMLTDEYDNRIYVLSAEDKSLFTVNTSDMNISEKINLNASPYRLTLSEDRTKLGYADKDTGLVYIMNIDGEYKSYPVTEFKNLSEMIIDNDTLYTLSRTLNKLTVTKFDTERENISFLQNSNPKEKLAAQNTKVLLGVPDFMPLNKSEKNKDSYKRNIAVSSTEIQTGSKPVKMLLRNDKLYVLCAGTNQLDVLDTNTLKYVTSVKLPLNGFVTGLTPIEKEHYAVITDSNGKRYALFNFETNGIEGVYPIDIEVGNIMVTDKINSIKILDENL